MTNVEQLFAVDGKVDPRALGIGIEAKLIDWRLSYEYDPEFPLAEIKVQTEAQVRTETSLADKDTLAEFRMQMSQGAVFPPVVLMHPNVLVDGNHRLAAIRSLRRKTAPAFVARFHSVDLAKTFAAAMNQMGGRRLGPEEAYEAARVMMDQGMADEAVAREIGRSVESVRTMRRRKEFAAHREQIIELKGLPVSQSAQIKLAAINLDRPFAEAVKFVAETKADAATVTELVNAAKAAHSEEAAVDAVKDIAARLVSVGPPPVRVLIPQPVRQSVMHISALLKLGDDRESLLDTATLDRQQAAVERWARLASLAENMLSLYRLAAGEHAA